MRTVPAFALFLAAAMTDAPGQSNDPDPTEQPVAAGPAQRPGRAPEGWEVVDDHRGAGGWARRVRDPRSGVVFVLIEPGRFRMGSDAAGDSAEKPAHDVEITRPFYLGETETTVAQWRVYVRATSCKHDPGGRSDRHPQAEVSWQDATAYCEHFGYRLPTEAEWEYACRAGSTADRYGEAAEIAWYDVSAGKVERPVRTKKPNAWGLYDMLGNLQEWCADAFDERFYARSPKQDPCNTVGDARVLRGGSWFEDVEISRAPGRFGDEPTIRYANAGFRPAMTPR